MPIERTNFEDITEADLKELIDGGVQEGLRIEYKSETCGNKDEDKKEFLKDVSSFMNAHGGHLIFGMKEVEGVASEICGLVDIDPDKELQRLISLINSGIEPRIQFHIRAISLEAGGHVIILRIPRSWTPPHRVKIKGWNKFWIRHSGGTHEASMQELRDLFTMSSGIIEKIREFRTDRNQSILSTGGQRPLTENEGLLSLHIIPFSAFSSPFQVDLRYAYDNHEMFRPIGENIIPQRPRVNFDGIIIERMIPENGYTQIFRNGIIEATKADIIWTGPKARVIPAQTFEKYILDALSQYIKGLNQLGVLPPLGILISLHGVQGVGYSISRSGAPDYSPRPFESWSLALPECILNEYGTKEDYDRTVKHAFEALWNDLGELKAMFFDENGVWDGNRQI